jgi:hypothetical protein
VRYRSRLVADWALRLIAASLAAGGLCLPPAVFPADKWVGEWDGPRGARLSYYLAGDLNANRPGDPRFNAATGISSYSPPPPFRLF